MDEFNREIEKFWRDRFADEIETQIMSLEDDEATKWFNLGVQHSARVVRYSRDES